jgi:hypothetical protein
MDFLKGWIVYRGLRYSLRVIRETICDYFPRLFLSKLDQVSLKELKDKHKGRPAVLIGGGPSINKMDLDKFQDYVTFGCNGFFLKMESLDWSPTYYTVEDPLPAMDNSKEISELADTHKIIPYDLKKYVKPYSGKTTYVDFRRSYLRPSHPDFPSFRKKDENRFYWGGTVMYYNIQLADYMGCDPIYLVGVDLNYVVPEGTRKNGAVLTSIDNDPNHFDPRYFGKGKKWHLPETERMQHSFNKAYSVLKERGVRLLNGGVESKLKNVPKSTIK